MRLLFVGTILLVLLFLIGSTFPLVLTRQLSADEWLFHFVLPFLTYALGAICGYLFRAPRHLTPVQRLPRNRQAANEDDEVDSNDV